MKNNEVQLKWKTSNNNDIQTIAIERSPNLLHFTIIGTITNTLGESIFKSEDKHPLKGNNYYRIKIIDKSGIANYSSVRLISNKPLSEEIIVSPNPISEGIIRLELINQPRGKYEFNIINIEGKGVFKGNFSNSHSANHSLRIPKWLLGGTYQLIITTPEGASSVKAILIR